MSVLFPLDNLKTTRECALKLLEEASEACEAIKKHDKEQKLETYQDSLLELVDVLQCVTNCLYVLNPSHEEFEAAVLGVRLYNRERGRHELHVGDDRRLTIKWDADTMKISLDCSSNV